MLVRESLEESLGFERRGEVKNSLGIGYAGKIRKFFGDLGIPDKDYIVEPSGEIIFENELNLENAEISELPNNLTVNGGLDISGSDIIKLPENLNVDSLYASNTTISELPVSFKIKDSLNLSMTNIEYLPDNLTLNGNLNLNEAYELTELPKKLSVKGWLDLSETYIETLPNDLQVGKIILVKGNQEKLIKFIKNSKFRNKLDIWKSW